MTNKPIPAVRKRRPLRPTNDRRVIRTRRALGSALVELMLEQHFDDIRVEQVLQRAKVARATFYAHFHNKHDLLIADVHAMCDLFMGAFSERGPGERRLAPVTELFGHVVDARDFIGTLDRAGLRDEVLNVITARLARCIARRLAHRGPSGGTSLSRPMMARMFAATLVEMLSWWMQNGASPEPREMDRQYHLIVTGGLDRLTI